MQTTTLVIVLAGLLLQTITGQGQLVDIVQTAINNGNFKTLVTALNVSSQVSFLKNVGPLTVFAPTDAAFAKLPPELLQRLLQPQAHFELVDILEYHIVPQNLTAAAIIHLNPPVRLESIVGRGLFVTKNGDSLRIDNANVVTANVFATNGIIHAIDEVLFPRRQ